MAGNDQGGGTAQARAASWQTYLTSAIGSDHVRAGRPNQDAIAGTRLDVPDSPGPQVFAVADGHGHARHFRSDRGSKFAVGAAVAAAEAWIGTLPAGTPVSQAAASQLVADVVARWRQMVADDLRADPIGEAERGALLLDDLPEIPYGATLLLGVLRPDVAVLAQIGDGEVLLVLPDGRHLEPIPTDSRLDGTQTTSLCQQDALSALRVALVNLAKTQVFAVFAATDGYGNAQAAANWPRGLAADLVRLASEHGLDWIGGQLSGWAAICASSDGSGDDSSVALALNSSAALTPPPRQARRPFGRRHDETTLPVIGSAAAERTLTLPAAAGGARDSGGPGEPATIRRPAVAPAALASSLATAVTFAKRPAVWLGAAIVAVLVVIVVVLLSSHGTTARSPAFQPTPKPTHSAARPTASATPSAGPSRRTGRTARATNTPTSGSGVSLGWPVFVRGNDGGND